VNIFSIPKTYRTARRLRRILNVFLKHGFGSMIDQINLGRYIPFVKRLRTIGPWMPAGGRGASTSERLVLAFAELGPSFIKLGQVLATRPDLIPQSYCDDFKRLQDSAPPFSTEQARMIIEAELGLPFEDLFARFEPEPIAAASIAQVHKACLLDGTRVIVKVQRPGIAEEIESDIDILRQIARLLERNVPESRIFSPLGVVREFERTITHELNFVREGRNCARIERHFENVEGVHIPHMFAEFTTQRVLVMERIKGIRIDDLDTLAKRGINREELAHRVVDVYFKMLFKDHLFHADPHPGNIYLKDSGEIALLDFGMVGRVNDDLRRILSANFNAFITLDFDYLIDQYEELGIVPDDDDLESYRRSFKDDLTELVEPLHDLELKDVNISEYLSGLLEIIINHRIALPSDMLLLNKVMLMLESIVSKLDPSFNLLDALKPYVASMAKDKFRPEEAMRTTVRAVTDAADFARVFPRQMRRIMRKSFRDEFRMRVSSPDLEHLTLDMDRSSNRLSVAIIIGCILLSSAIMHAMDVGPTWHGLSLLGFMVFGLAAFLGMLLIISIFRSGRL
jgi:ubiquinone biosynthesis protein